MNLIAPGSIGFLIVCLLAFVLSINVWTFFAFGLDKRRAVQGAWRVPENTLLMLALVGGWPGAKTGQRWFRHKTRKQPFGMMLNLIGALQVVVIGAGIWAAGHRDAGSSVDIDWIVRQFDTGNLSQPEGPMPRRFGPGSADW